MKKYLEKVKEIAKSLDWNVSIDENYINFQTFSSAGQDFNMSIVYPSNDNIWEFIESIYSYYDNFDCSYEAYLWLDESGHGKNGAPYEMIDVYKDMEECEEEMHRLWYELNNYDWDSEED